MFRTINHTSTEQRAAYIRILRMRLVRLRRIRNNEDSTLFEKNEARTGIAAVLVRIRYTRRNRTNELAKYGSPLYAPRIAPGAEA